MQIPWLFPILIFSLTFNKIPWLFPDFCQVWNFPDFSLTAGHPESNLTHIIRALFISFFWRTLPLRLFVILFLIFTNVIFITADAENIKDKES